jgi:hypothetical protein
MVVVRGIYSPNQYSVVVVDGQNSGAPDTPLFIIW